FRNGGGRNDVCSNILVCSRGGGGLLVERMELVAELENVSVAQRQADFVPLCDPSLTEQYEYANEHEMKCLVVMTTESGLVKVRHLELKKEREVLREEIVKFLSMAVTTHFRNPSIWN
ncbi:non-specific serine/threonine protein kinase, partial [Genlisea aurea]